MTLGLREKNMSLSIYSQGTGSGGEAICQGHTVSEQWDLVSLPLSSALATIPCSLSAAAWPPLDWCPPVGVEWGGTITVFISSSLQPGVT